MNELSVSRDQSLRQIVDGLRSLAAGDTSVHVSPDGDPLTVELANAFNALAAQHARSAAPGGSAPANSDGDGEVGSADGHAGALQALQDQLRLRQLDLERATTSRDRFYATMSHELRTPINAMLGYSTLLLESIYGPLNSQQVVAVERSLRAARHLLELVNDVLDLSKIEAGKIVLHPQRVVLSSVIDDLFATVRPLAEEHGSSLESISRDAEPTIISDPKRIRQIMLHLLSNAIRFGKGRPIRVECESRTDGGVIIRVIDQGEGIAAEDHDRIFDEFVQVGKSESHGGTGLGLSISRRLAELLGGTLAVESAAGEGSTFSLTLPALV